MKTSPESPLFARAVASLLATSARAGGSAITADTSNPAGNTAIVAAVDGFQAENPEILGP